MQSVYRVVCFHRAREKPILESLESWTSVFKLFGQIVVQETTVRYLRNALQFNFSQFKYEN